MGSYDRNGRYDPAEEAANNATLAANCRRLGEQDREERRKELGEARYEAVTEYRAYLIEQIEAELRRVHRFRKDDRIIFERNARGGDTLRVKLVKRERR